jgi:hypothetical protein
MLRVAFAAAVSLCFCAPAMAQKAPIGAPTGKWVVFGEADPMTDKMSCIAYYGGEKFVQLTNNSFAMGYGGRGGLKGYTIRFDNDPPLPMALPTRIEERIGAFVIDTKDPRFARLVAAKRVRIQALTVLNSIVNDDVDLTDLQAVRGRLIGPECA